MHRLYLEWMKEHATSSTPATLRQYRDTFNSEFNIGFYIPKKDQCEECHQFSNLNDEQRSEQQFTHNIHLHNKQRARELKNIDKGLNSEKTIVACFDFQKILPVPTADISVFYYKRKLAVYNFTIYNLKTKRATCYVWDETTAKKGANEVISCLYQFIKSEKYNDVNQFIFWSDNCYGQNKNRIVFGGYSWLAKTLEVSISHKFLEKGHTQNEGDSVHSVIEREKKGKLFTHLNNGILLLEIVERKNQKIMLWLK